MTKILLYTAVLVLVAVVLSPYLWLFISSISTKADLTKVPLSFSPPKPTFESYSRLFRGGVGVTDAASQFKRAVLNSLVVALVVTFISIFVGSLAAYTLTRFRFKGRDLLNFLVIIPQLLPRLPLLFLCISLLEDWASLTQSLHLCSPITPLFYPWWSGL